MEHTTKRFSKVDKLARNVDDFLQRQAGPDLAYWNKQLGYDGPLDYKLRPQPPRASALPPQPPSKPSKQASRLILLSPKSSDCQCIMAAKAACSNPQLVTSWDKFCTCDVPPTPEELDVPDEATPGPSRATKLAPTRKKISLAKEGIGRGFAPGLRRGSGPRLSTQVDAQTKKLTSAVGLDLNKYSEAGVDVMIRPVKGPPARDSAKGKKAKVVAESVDLTLLPKGLTGEELLSRGGRRDTILILRPPAEPPQKSHLPSSTEPPKVVLEEEAPLELVIQFMEAVMEKKYDEALKDAHAILELEPKNDLVKAYLPVLQQLIDLENSDGSWCSDESSDESSRSRGSAASESETTEAVSEDEAEEGQSDESSSSNTSSSDASSSGGSVSSVSSVLTDEYASEYEDSDEFGRFDDGYGTDSSALMNNLRDAEAEERIRVLQQARDEQVAPPTPAPTPEPSIPPATATHARKHKKKLSAKTK